MKKGFTLIELLIVIGIIAILATAVLLVLNPAQILAETRDTQRLSDLDVTRGAINLFLSTVANPNLSTENVAFTCGTNFGASVASATKFFLGALAGGIKNAGVRTVAGAGWVPINFAGMAGGSPIATLPQDPINNTGGCSGSVGCNYQYSCDNTNRLFELDANLESVKYSQGGASDKESTDGGDVTTIYEVGNSLTL